MKIKIRKQKNKLGRAVFLDRDGVINQIITRGGESRPPWNLDELKLISGVKKACAMLKQSGYALIIATNQPDVGRGFLSQDIVEAMHSFIIKKLSIDRVEVCYHPGRELSYCNCRKPLPGMLNRAAYNLGLDLQRSWMIGDRFSDIECGYLAGCKTILIGNGYNEISRITPNFKVQNLLEAAKIIAN